MYAEPLHVIWCGRCKKKIAEYRIIDPKLEYKTSYVCEACRKKYYNNLEIKETEPGEERFSKKVRFRATIPSNTEGDADIVAKEIELANERQKQKAIEHKKARKEDQQRIESTVTSTRMFMNENPDEISDMDFFIPHVTRRTTAQKFEPDDRQQPLFPEGFVSVSDIIIEERKERKFFVYPIVGNKINKKIAATITENDDPKKALIRMLENFTAYKKEWVTGGELFTTEEIL